MIWRGGGGVRTIFVFSDRDVLDVLFLVAVADVCKI